MVLKQLLSGSFSDELVIQRNKRYLSQKTHFEYLAMQIKVRFNAPYVVVKICERNLKSMVSNGKLSAISENIVFSTA